MDAIKSFILSVCMAHNPPNRCSLRQGHMSRLRSSPGSPCCRAWKRDRCSLCPTDAGSKQHLERRRWPRTSSMTLRWVCRMCTPSACMRGTRRRARRSRHPSRPGFALRPSKLGRSRHRYRRSRCPLRRRSRGCCGTCRGRTGHRNRAPARRRLERRCSRSPATCSTRAARGGQPG